MSTAAVRSIPSSTHRRPSAGDAKANPSLCRGVVTVVRGEEVDVLLPDGSVTTALFALALPYAACEGDDLLVIGEGDQHFVIGVIRGCGKTSLALQGDVSLRAVGGTLAIAGDKGLQLSSPLIEVHAGDLRVVARAVVETFVTAFQRVSELLHVHARQEMSIVDEASYKQAGTASIQSEGTVTVQGKEIHVG